jgi:imidazolonepropionase-like amidohydrolase
MTALLLNDVNLIDGAGRDPRPHAAVLVEDGRIARIAAAGAITPIDGARSVDCAGMTLMPGLTDAHVHFGLTAAGANPPPESLLSYVLKVVDNIRIALDEGFTTVRDAGGLDPAYAAAVESGEIPGPRILPSGSFLSQTGGHGDQRPRFDDHAPPSVPGIVAHTEICDGVDAVRRAARVQVRRGATQVKLMASGGVMSPTDPLESLQFSVEEMAAAVHEAASFGRYVMAHTHTSGAINRALDAGVRSLEHCSILDEATARRIAQHGAFAVPTLVILEILARAGQVPEFSRRKLELVRGQTGDSVRNAAAAGAKIGSGSDLLGPRQSRRASELVEKAKHLGPLQAIVSATATNAELFCMADRIGTVEDGKDADLVLVDGDPLADIAVLVDARNIPLVLKSGVVCKDARALVPA